MGYFTILQLAVNSQWRENTAQSYDERDSCIQFLTELHLNIEFRVQQFNVLASLESFPIESWEGTRGQSIQMFTAQIVP